jgi:hypothetical protein
VLLNRRMRRALEEDEESAIRFESVKASDEKAFCL